MIEDIKHCVEEQLKEDTEEKVYTYPVRINENMAVGLFKDIQRHLRLEIFTECLSLLSHRITAVFYYRLLNLVSTPFLCCFYGSLYFLYLCTYLNISFFMKCFL